MFPTNLSNYSQIIETPLKEYKETFSENSLISKTVNHACQTMCTISSIGEYMLLDAVLHDIEKIDKGIPRMESTVEQRSHRHSDKQGAVYLLCNKREQDCQQGRHKRPPGPNKH